MSVCAGGLVAVVAYGLKGSGDANLPIINGPQTSGEHAAAAAVPVPVPTGASNSGQLQAPR